MRDLNEIRQEINEIDEKLTELFRRRMDCARDVAEYKKANDIPILNAEREREVLDRVQERGGEYGLPARLLYTDIMELSRALQHTIVGSGSEMRRQLAEAEELLPTKGVKVAYQGIKGANGHEAAIRLFPDAEKINAD